MSKLIFIVGISSAVLLHSCVTMPVSTPECEILDYGVLSGVPDKRVLKDLNDGSNRKLGSVSGVLVIEKTTNVIPAELGQSFGISHRFSGAPKSTKIKLVTSHPAITYDGVVSTENTRYKKITDNGTIFSFDLPEEMKSGKWSFVFSYSGKELCRQEFDVVGGST